MVAQATAALQPDELLRAEWAARVSALDLYVHELVTTHLVEIFTGARPACPGFGRFQISGDALMRIQSAPTPADRAAAFELEVRIRLSRITYQAPDDIADGIRMISPCSLWNDSIPARRYGGKIRCRVRSRRHEPKPRADEPKLDDDGRFLHSAASPGLFLLHGAYISLQNAAALEVMGANRIFDRGPAYC